ncbi:hypothetical protein GCM10025870_21610 [Agromyces marinus]|uniref:GNAT family N-acetyltransferase n=1 Tax=Agromyces marinus TaxID=1389020 RepID=A0ABM8H2Q7_9MICO|nr:hypothetical protein GCM10025870_21610 [Agromyces marinus]
MGRHLALTPLVESDLSALRAAIAKLGAVFEGVNRRIQRRPDGSWRDTAVFSVLADEWPAVRAGLEARVAAFGDHPVVLGSRRHPTG